jgi:hypothetical protein
MPRPPCRHCRLRPVSRNHCKLCPACLRLPSVRRRHAAPPIRPEAPAVPEDLARRLWGPTRGRPGSLAKIVALEVRVDWGLPLWHPLDATTDGADPAEGDMVRAAIKEAFAERLRRARR